MSEITSLGAVPLGSVIRASGKSSMYTVGEGKYGAIGGKIFTGGERSTQR